ncbi:MAG: hypothetical protein AAGN35_07395 [Bacteroidota bacterium]
MKQLISPTRRSAPSLRRLIIFGDGHPGRSSGSVGPATGLRIIFLGNENPAGTSRRINGPGNSLNDEMSRPALPCGEYSRESPLARHHHPGIGHYRRDGKSFRCQWLWSRSLGRSQQ